MRRIFTLIALVFGVTIILNAQSFDLIDENHNLITDSTIDVYTVPGQDVIYDFKIVNNTSEPIDTRIEKIYISIVDGSNNFFCIPSGACIMPSTMVSPAFEVAALDTTKACQVDYIPGSNLGTSTIEYKIFNDDMPSDHASFTINFIVEASNVEQVQTNRLNLYPNPASEEFYIDVTGYENSVVEIYNVLGSVVKRYEIQSNDNKMLIDCSKWNSGVYFARLTDRKNTIKTIRFVVK